MRRRTHKVIGIIGGMGPDATITLLQRIVDLTPARVEQDHLPVVVDNNPGIPDRTEAILKGGASPFPFLQASSRRLEEAGVEILGMPCNTAHAYYDRLSEILSVPLINMVGLAQKKAEQAQLKLGKPVMLLSTEGTVKAEIYKNFILPEEKQQKKLMSIIYSVKEGENLQKMQNEFVTLLKQIEEKAGGVILGCTELSFLYTPPYHNQLANLPVLVIDPLNELAQELVRRSYKK